MTPVRGREMIDFVREAFQVSIRRACRAVPAPRATYHYRSRRPEQAPLRKRIREIAETRMRYGYRRIHVLLRREGWHVNVKRVRRLYNLEGLQMRIDTWSRVCPVMRVCRSATAMEVIGGLEQARSQYGVPKVIRGRPGQSVHLEGA
jgi:putative transposase